MVVKSVSALSGAACATFLPQAFLSYAIGEVFHVEIARQIGDVMGSMAWFSSWCFSTTCVWNQPSLFNDCRNFFDEVQIITSFYCCLPNFLLIKEIEKRVTGGLDLIVVVFSCSALN